MNRSLSPGVSISNLQHAIQHHLRVFLCGCCYVTTQLEAIYQDFQMCIYTVYSALQDGSNFKISG